MSTHPSKSVPGGPPPGRPTIYKKEFIEKITTRMLEGESVRSICSDPKLPALSTIMRWYVEDKPQFKEFREHYDRALKGYGILKGLEAVDITDENPKKRVVVKDGAEEKFVEIEETDSAGITRNTSRAKVRLMVASKIARKHFGERIEVEQTVTFDIAERMRAGMARVDAERKKKNATR